MNCDSRLRTNPAYQHLQILQPQGYTPSSRRETRPRDMDEYGAAAAGHSGLRVVVNLDKQVIDAIVAPQAVAWFTGRPLKCLIIAPVGRIFAPGIGGTDAAQRQ